MDAMTLSGTKVEGYEKFDSRFGKIIVGRIEEDRKTPGCRIIGNLSGGNR